MKFLIISFLFITTAHAEYKLNPYTNQRDYYESTSALAQSTGAIQAEIIALKEAGVGGSTIAINTAQFTGNGAVSNPLNINLSSITAQGNTFNGNGQLLKLDSSGKILITNLPTDGYSGTYINVGEQIPGSQVDTSTITAAIALKVDKAGDSMTGQLTIYGSSLTVGGIVGATRYDLFGSTALAYGTGIGATLVGQNTGSNSTGIGATFLGNQTGTSNTIGAYNLFIGGGAGYTNTTGSYNSYIGNLSGFLSTGDRNTFVGYNSGYKTTGSNNIFIGYKTGEDATSGSGNVIIGYDIEPQAATTSNFLNIAGLIHGTVSSSSVTIKGDLYSDGKVTTPEICLAGDCQTAWPEGGGGGDGGSPIFQFQNFYANTNGTNRVFQLSSAPVNNGLFLTKNGVEMVQPDDYTLYTDSITMVTAPVSSTTLAARYVVGYSSLTIANITGTNNSWTGTNSFSADTTLSGGVVGDTTFETTTSTITFSGFVDIGIVTYTQAIAANTCGRVACASGTKAISGQCNQGSSTYVDDSFPSTNTTSSATQPGTAVSNGGTNYFSHSCCFYAVAGTAFVTCARVK